MANGAGDSEAAKLSSRLDGKKLQIDIRQLTKKVRPAFAAMATMLNEPPDTSCSPASSFGPTTLV